MSGNDYPLHSAIGQLEGTTLRYDDGTVVTRGPSGTPFFKTLYFNLWGSFDVVHQVNNSNRVILESHYQANKLLPFNFVYNMDGVTYTCRYIRAPQSNPIPGNLNNSFTNSFVVVQPVSGFVVVPITGAINVTGSQPTVPTKYLTITTVAGTLTTLGGGSTVTSVASYSSGIPPATLSLAGAQPTVIGTTISPAIIPVSGSLSFTSLATPNLGATTDSTNVNVDSTGYYVDSTVIGGVAPVMGSLPLITAQPIVIWFVNSGVVPSAGAVTLTGAQPVSLLSGVTTDTQNVNVDSTNIKTDQN